MGTVAGIVAAPCTGPILAAVLTYVATTRKLLLGILQFVKRPSTRIVPVSVDFFLYR
jgi:hypothetical protein